MKKRFGFQLDEELHAALEARANEEGTSMAAICREALSLHLQKPTLEVPPPPRPDTTGSAWTQLKGEVRGFLDGLRDDVMEELDDFLSEPSLFRPEQTPDAFYRTERPRIKRPGYVPPSRPYNVRYSGDDGTRWLDELWA